MINVVVNPKDFNLLLFASFVYFSLKFKLGLKKLKLGYNKLKLKIITRRNKQLN